MEKIGRWVSEDDYLFQPYKKFPQCIQEKLSHTALGYIVGKWQKEDCS